MFKEPGKCKEDCLPTGSSPVREAPINAYPKASWAMEWFLYGTVVLFALGIGLVFLREPGFGDELTYWSLAFDLHDLGKGAWSEHSFHDLRWPVWGVSWLWQCLFGPGLASYYCTPLIYLAAAASAAFTFGRLVLRSVGLGFLCVVTLLFLPVLDPVIDRAMPDLSESLFGSCALYFWWAMMSAASPRRSTMLGCLAGAFIGLAYSNRVTGIFIAPALAILTLLYFPRRSIWLLVPATVAALYFAVEGWIYFQICGDWLHSIHANLGGRGATDVHAMPPWQLPFRYLNALTHGNRLAPVYSGLAIVGLWSGWTRWQANGRLLVVWFGVLYLEYSCALQSIHPVRPLLGSTARYLGALAIPMALLVALGTVEVGRWLKRIRWKGAMLAVRRCCTHPKSSAALGVLLLILYTGRPVFDLGFTRFMSKRMATLPDRTRIFTHRVMRDMAFLVDPRDAARFSWLAPKSILLRDESLEDEAAHSDEFWYLRKQLWMSQRKRMERTGSTAQQELGSYLTVPERDWMLCDVLARGQDSDLVFYRRRPAGMPAPHTLAPDSPELKDLLPALPVSWSNGSMPKTLLRQWNVSADLRGKLVALQIGVASTTVEPFTLRLRFMQNGRQLADYVLKPIAYGGGGKEYLVLSIPAGAEVCKLEVRIAEKTKELSLSSFRALYDDAR